MSKGYQLVNDDGSITTTAINGLDNPLIAVQGFAAPIDGTSAGSTKFPAVPTGMVFYLSELRIGIAGGISGVVTEAIIDLGIAGGSGGELIPTTTLSGLNAGGLEIVLRPTLHKKPTAGQQVSLNITTPYVATTAMLYAALIGFYVPE